MTADYVFRTLRQMILTLERRVSIIGGSGGGINQLTGDVTAGPGTGSQAATIPANTVTEAQQVLADNTTYDVSTSRHGYTPKAPNDTTKFLRGDGTWATASVGGGGGGGLVLLEQHTASASATLDFTSWYSTAYDDYQIELIGLLPATDGASFLLTVSTNGGSTWAATNYGYASHGIGTNNAPGSLGASGATSITITNGNENTTSTGMMSGWMRAFDPGSTTRVKGFTFDVAFQSNNSNYYKFTGAGWWMDASNNIDALRFAFSSGNIAEGTIRMYGIAKS